MLNAHRQGIAERILHRRFALAFLAFAVVSLGVFTVPTVHAPGEVYTFSVSSSRVQEYNAPGVTLYVNVTNAVVGGRYQLTFNVRDPNGAGKNSSNSTTATSSTFVLSVVYPRDFGAGLVMKYVGTYTINVAQNQPSAKPSVAIGQFQVGLTDSVTYQRTYPISIEATGYQAGENITTSLVHSGIPAPGFPTSLLADPGGSLNFSWRIPPSEPLGAYTLTLAGSSTAKTPQDTQTFTILATTVSVPGLTVNSPSISRSLTEQFLFAPQYPDGQRIQTGLATIRIAESDGVYYANATGNYDGSTGTFRGKYYVPRDAMTGIWVATVDPKKFDDGYGNLGPALAVSTGFNIQPASLNVSVVATGPTGKTYAPGDLIPVYTSVSYPDGTAFASGTVTAKFSHSGIIVGSPVSLSYIPGQQEWAGNYQVTSNDPSGIWLITVDASDQLVDTGEGTSSAAVNVPPATPQPTGVSTSSFLLLAAIAAAAALAVLFWALLVARKKTTRQEVKLDLRVVDKEVDRIQDSEFFKNVKKQVEEKKPPSTDPPPPKTDTKPPQSPPP